MNQTTKEGSAWLCTSRTYSLHAVPQQSPWAVGPSFYAVAIKDCL